MTLLDPTPQIRSTTRRDDFEPVPFDLYRDIHKGIRAELFAITSAAGSIDPSDACGRAALADHVASMARVLDSHREHEDAAILPAMVEHLPDLADHIEAEHPVLEARFGSIVELAADAAAAATVEDQRRLAHVLYLEMSEYTSAYLAHQLVEERVIMPALERVVGLDAVVGMHAAIISSIPPDEMAASLSFMLPAMNVDDRSALLGGMRATAPAEAFAGVVSLARSVLDPVDFSAVARRLAIA